MPWELSIERRRKKRVLSVGGDHPRIVATAWLGRYRTEAERRAEPAKDPVAFLASYFTRVPRGARGGLSEASYNRRRTI